MKVWSNDEIDYLKKHYCKFPLKEIAKRLNRSKGSVRTKAYILKVNRDFRWKDEELDIIKIVYECFSKKGDINLNSLSALFGRSKASICQKARKMGLTIRNRKPNKKEKDRFSKYEFKTGHSTWNKGKKLPQISGKKNPFYGKKHSKKTKNALSRKLKEAYKNGKIHARGMLGKTHTSKARARISTGNSKQWQDPTSKFNSQEYRDGLSKRQSSTMIERMQNGWNPYSNAKSGTREDLGIFVRSKMEANYLRYLNFIKMQWQYEPKIFYFKGIKKGTLTYTPDIYLPDKDEWIEIKGWFRDKDRTKLKRFKKYFPKEFKKLIFVVENPWGETKSAIKIMNFLIDELDISNERIEDFREIKNKLGGLIPNWE